jgi:hypothetical protein
MNDDPHQRAARRQPAVEGASSKVEGGGLKVSGKCHLLTFDLQPSTFNHSSHGGLTPRRSLTLLHHRSRRGRGLDMVGSRRE